MRRISPHNGKELKIWTIIDAPVELKYGMTPLILMHTLKLTGLTQV